MARGRVVVLHEGTVALIERQRDGRTYYVFPGGGAEPGELTRQAARREAEEELGLRVEIEEFLAHDVHEGESNDFFTARIVGGAFGSGHGAEMTAEPTSASGSYAPVWIPISQLAGLSVLPEPVALLIATQYRHRDGEIPVS